MNRDLRSIVADTLGLDAADVTPDLCRESEAAWDSLNHLRLITALEETFDVKLSMAQIQGITTAGDLEALIDGRDGG
jgi:acyl carrier protein